MVRKKKVRSHAKRKIPIMATGGAVLSIADLIFGRAVGYERSVYEYVKTGNYKDAGTIARKQAMEWQTWAPVVGGVIGSALASKGGFNRYLSAIPWFKL